MQDVDGDARADRVRLTYSEPVRHVADRDGTFPFTVAGYRFRAVGRASGKAIVVLLVERSTVDGALQPVGEIPAHVLPAGARQGWKSGGRPGCSMALTRTGTHQRRLRSHSRPNRLRR